MTFETTGIVEQEITQEIVDFAVDEGITVGALVGCALSARVRKVTIGAAPQIATRARPAGFPVGLPHGLLLFLLSSLDRGLESLITHGIRLTDDILTSLSSSPACNGLKQIRFDTIRVSAASAALWTARFSELEQIEIREAYNGWSEAHLSAMCELPKLRVLRTKLLFSSGPKRELDYATEADFLRIQLTGKNLKNAEEISVPSENFAQLRQLLEQLPVEQRNKLTSVSNFLYLDGISADEQWALRELLPNLRCQLPQAPNFSLQNWAAHAPYVSNLLEVVLVEPDPSALTDDAIAAAALASPNLEYLNIFCEADLPKCPALDFFSNLRALSFELSSIPFHKMILPRSLELLDCWQNILPTTEETIEWIDRLVETAPNLQDIRFSCFPNEECARYLVSRLPRLRRLRVENFVPEPENDCNQSLSVEFNVRGLYESDNAVPEFHSDSAAVFASARSISSMSVHGLAPMFDLPPAIIVSQSNLVELVLRNVVLSDAGWAIFPVMPSLASLDLNQCSMTEATIRELLYRLPSLVAFSLSDSGFKSLEWLQHDRLVLLSLSKVFSYPAIILLDSVQVPCLANLRLQDCKMEDVVLRNLPNLAEVECQWCSASTFVLENCPRLFSLNVSGFAWKSLTLRDTQELEVLSMLQVSCESYTLGSFPKLRKVSFHPGYSTPLPFPFPELASFLET